MIVASDGGGGFHQTEDVSSEARQRIGSLGAAIGRCAVAKARQFGSIKDLCASIAVRVSFRFICRRSLGRRHQEHLVE